MIMVGRPAKQNYIVKENKNMTAFKRFVKAKGIKLEADYPYLPYDLSGPTIEGVKVDQETATVYVYRVVGTEILTFNRTGSYEFDFD